MKALLIIAALVPAHPQSGLDHEWKTSRQPVSSLAVCRLAADLLRKDAIIKQEGGKVIARCKPQPTWDRNSNQQRKES